MEKKVIFNLIFLFTLILSALDIIAVANQPARQDKIAVFDCQNDGHIKESALKLVSEPLISILEENNHILSRDDIIKFCERNNVSQANIINDKNVMLNFRRSTGVSKILTSKISKLRHYFISITVIDTETSMNINQETLSADNESEIKGGLVNLVVLLSVSGNLPVKDGQPSLNDKKVQNQHIQAVTFYNLGNEHLTKSNYDEAISCYDKALKLNTALVEAYNNRANSYQRKGLYGKAESDFSKAVSINPKFVDAYINRGALYEYMGMPEKSLKDYDCAIQINPYLANAYINKAMLCEYMGRPEQAIESYYLFLKHACSDDKAIGYVKKRLDLLKRY